MTNNRSLSWIDRGHWEELLARVTDEPAPTYRPPRPAARTMSALPLIKPPAPNGSSTIQIAVPPAPRLARSNTSPISARPPPPRPAYRPFVASSRQV